MAQMKTLREIPLGSITLRLVKVPNGFAAIAIKGAEIIAREDGADADDLWRRIQDAAAPLTPPPGGARRARKAVRETRLGSLRLRLEKTDVGFVGLALEGREIKVREEGQNSDDVWRRLHDAAARLNPLFIGYSSARARFRRFFPDGFAGDHYVEMERGYKWRAKELLEASAPLVAVAVGRNFGEAVAPIPSETNLLDPRFEAPMLRALLKGPAGDEFVRLCAAFAQGDGKPALQALETLLKPHNCAKWTIVTYLPFLWRPEVHMFLKPKMLRDFAERVGHRFASDYRPGLDIEVYEALLDLAAETRAELADIAPRDMIDIQSFMWTVVEYKEEDKAASA